MKHYQTGLIEFWNVQEPTLMRIRIGTFGRGCINGEKTSSELKLTDLMIGMVSRPDEIARVKSFTPEGLQADASKIENFFAAVFASSSRTKNHRNRCRGTANEMDKARSPNQRISAFRFQQRPKKPKAR